MFHIMGAYLSLEVAKFGIDYLIGSAIRHAVLPNNHGGCSLLPKVLHQLEELEFQKAADGQIFPGSVLSFDGQQRSNWMSDIFETRPIGEIIWPGTHHSATNQIGIRFLTRPYGERQTLSIYRQLRQGVRALDIRIQHDRFVCNGNISSVTTIDDVISDIEKFLSETKNEIILLEIQTERGYADPADFEAYLENHLGDFLIHQDPKVFTQTIQQVLPRRIICVWKPNDSPAPKYGGPIWASEYLEGDEVATQMPLDKFKGSINSLKDRLANSDMEIFYKVEYTLTPQATSLMEWLLVWPRHAKVVSKRINDYARLFLAKCHAEGLLHRLQILNVDFVDEDFISACIALNKTLKPQSSQFIVPARDLSIVWGGDKKYWQSSTVSSNGNGHLDVAELLKVSWLEISGKFDMDRLSKDDFPLLSGITYEVIYVIKLKASSSGMESIKFSIVLSEDRWEEKVERTENLDDKPRGTWLSITAGTLFASRRYPILKCVIKFTLYGNVNLERKSGLIVKSVIIKAKITPNP